MSVLLPPSMRASPDYPVDAFMADVKGLKPDLDVERTKKLREGVEDEVDQEE